MKNVCKVGVFLTDMANFAAMNRVYETFFEDPKPVCRSMDPILSPLRTSPKGLTNGGALYQCRTCVAVKELPMKTDVEIELIAHL